MQLALIYWVIQGLNITGPCRPSFLAWIVISIILCYFYISLTLNHILIFQLPSPLLLLYFLPKCSIKPKSLTQFRHLEGKKTPTLDPSPEIFKNRTEVKSLGFLSWPETSWKELPGAEGTPRYCFLDYNKFCCSSLRVSAAANSGC